MQIARTERFTDEVFCATPITFICPSPLCYWPPPFPMFFALSKISLSYCPPKTSVACSRFENTPSPFYNRKQHCSQTASQMSVENSVGGTDQGLTSDVLLDDRRQSHPVYVRQLSPACHKPTSEQAHGSSPTAIPRFP